jgi:hypothetical protein
MNNSRKNERGATCKQITCNARTAQKVAIPEMLQSAAHGYCYEKRGSGSLQNGCEKISQFVKRSANA